MPQYNEPHNYPSRRNSYSSRSPQRTNIPNARDELERERELYSAHDPHQSAPSPAQRYARAQQEKNEGNRHCYWSQHANDTGSNTPASYSSSSNKSRTRETLRWDQNAQQDYAGLNPSSSNQIPPVSNPSRTSTTPRVGEAAFSGRIPRQADPTQSGRIPQQTDSALSGRIPRQNHPSQSGRIAYPSTATTDGTQTTQQSKTPHAYGNSRRSTNRRSAVNTHSRSQAAERYANRSGNPADFGADRYLGSKRPRSSGSKRFVVIGLVAVIAIAVIGVFAFTTWNANKPVTVTINDQQYTIEGQQRSLEGLIETGTISVTPGNYVAVDGSVMREGEGTPATASVNGETKEDLSTHLNEGDTISLGNGTDIMEEYSDSEPSTLTPSYEMQGTGAVHLYTVKAEPGEKITRTGNESGKTIEITTKEPVNGVVQCYNVNTNGEKVIALTFDDGPWDTSTEAILDILKENGAKATFFTVGQKIPGHEDTLKRAINEGHELATHTYDHAAGSGQGVSLILMSKDERRAEIEKGIKAIEDATGTEASRTFRSPGGNFDSSVATDVSDLITSEIGWNIDTTDWKKPGADTIASRIESADPGEIILMHDGGGDRSQTVEGLRKALPKLKEQGYSFITVSELLNRYPYQG